MRHPPILALASVLAACTQVLGIDGNYTPVADTPASAGGRAASFDAAMASRPPVHDPSAAGSGGATASGGYPNEPPPPPFQSSGGTIGGPPESDAGHRCAPGEKWCGACVRVSPSVGCATTSCNACVVTDSNAQAVCDEAGHCDVVCNPGLVRNVDRCERHADAGTGGSTGTGGAAGGASGSGGAGGSGTGGTGTGGRGDVCNPLACPTCSRGFEGCCIPAVPGMPSHCGCFYFPPLCTKDVG